MANIFRSKDVFKRVPGIPSHDDPLRVVKGMYVVGEYNPPYYINSGITISNINTTKATVVDYTQKNADSNDNVVNVLNIDVIGDLSIAYYTRQSYSLQTDNVVNIVNIDVDPTPLDILYYTTSNQNPGNDHVLNVVNIDADTSPLDIVYYSTIEYPCAPEPMLRIKSISTTKATISEGDGT